MTLGSNLVGGIPLPKTKYFQFPISVVYKTTSPDSVISKLLGIYLIYTSASA
jgi:hypothetical protein